MVSYCTLFRIFKGIFAPTKTKGISFSVLKPFFRFSFKTTSEFPRRKSHEQIPSEMNHNFWVIYLANGRVQFTQDQYIEGRIKKGVLKGTQEMTMVHRYSQESSKVLCTCWENLNTSYYVCKKICGTHL